MHGLVREPAEAALHSAHARAVGTDLARAHDDARVRGARGASARRSDTTSGRGGRGSGTGTGSSRRRSVGVGGGAVARDGAAGAGAVLLNGLGLELGVRLRGGGVDAEDHAGAAVVALAAVEPWSRKRLVGDKFLGLGEKRMAYKEACQP